MINRRILGGICLIIVILGWVGSEPVSANGVPVQKSLRPVGDWLLVSEYSDSHTQEFTPAIAYNTNRKTHLIVWERDLRIYGKVIAGSTSLTAPFLISTTNGTNHTPDVAYCPGFDGWYVVYEKGGFGIYGRIISFDGSLYGTELTITAQAAGQTLNQPSIACNNITALVVYHRSQGAAFHQISARFHDYTYGALTETSLTDLVATGMGEPAVAYNPYDLQFMAVWQKEYLGNYDIEGQRLKMDDAGNMVKEAGIIAIHNLAQNETKPAIAALPMMSVNGQYLVAAEIEISGQQYINARLLQWNGNYVTNILPVSLEYGIQPAIAANLTQHEFWLVWQHHPGTIMASRFTDQSLSSDQMINYGGVDTMHPDIAPGNNGDFIIVQDSTPAGRIDIYARIIGNRIYLPLTQK